MVPPVPIPNTVVKHSEAESTCLETDWEDRKLPVKQRVPLRRGSFSCIRIGYPLEMAFVFADRYDI